MKRNIMINTSIEKDGDHIDGAIMVSYLDPNDIQAPIIGITAIPYISSKKILNYFISIGIMYSNTETYIVELNDFKKLLELNKKLSSINSNKQSCILAEDKENSILLEPEENEKYNLLYMNNNTKKKILIDILYKDDIGFLNAMSCIVKDYITTKYV